MTKINKMGEFLCRREMSDAKRLSIFRYLLVLTLTPSTYNSTEVTADGIMICELCAELRDVLPKRATAMRLSLINI